MNGRIARHSRHAGLAPVQERVRRHHPDYAKLESQGWKAVELESKRRAWVSKLSGGQKQRLSVACAMAGRPDLLFLDEPTTGLDPQSRRQLWGVLERFREGGGTILITTHYMDEAHALCDRVGIMDHGKLIALGTPVSLVASLGAEHMIQFALSDGQPVPADDLLQSLPGVTAVRHEANHRPFRGMNRARAAVLEGAILVSRLGMLPPDKVDREIAYLQIAIDKTAGPAELEA